MAQAKAEEVDVGTRRAKPRGAAALAAARTHLEGGGDNSGESGDGPAGGAGENSGDGGAAEQAHTSAIERMEAIATETQLVLDSLVFDIRDFLLEQIKVRPKPWSATSEGEQRDVAAACEHAATELVRKAVEAIRADARDPIRALVTKVTLGDDIQITLKAKPFTPEESDAAVMGLHHAHGKHVLITVASADDYTGGQRDPEVDPDAPALDFEAGSDHPGDDSDLLGDDEEQRQE